MLIGLLLTHSLSGFLAFLYWYLTAYPTRRIRNKNIQNTTNRSFATINDIATACEHYKTAAHYPQDCLAHLNTNKPRGTLTTDIKLKQKTSTHYGYRMSNGF